MNEFLQVCEAAARAGGAVLLDWAGRCRVREKGPADLVTEADLASQDVVRGHLLGAFPQHGFLGEENASIASRDNGYRWIVDPLDGTTNYVHGVPQYCVSVALEQNGKVLVGAVFDPVGQECFTGAAGEGAWLNGQPIRVSRVARLDQAVVAMSLPPAVQREDAELKQFIEVVVRAQSMRRMGSSALNLCYVACGRFDAYWSISTKVWDIAAGVLLVREAGGLVLTPEGGALDLHRPRFVAAATPGLSAELRAALAEAG